MHNKVKGIFTFMITFVLSAVSHAQTIDGTIQKGPTMKDYDGNIYPTILVDGQYWTAEPIHSKHDRYGNAFSLRSYHNLFDKQGNFINKEGIDTIGGFLFGGVSEFDLDNTQKDIPTAFEGWVCTIDNPATYEGEWHPSFFYNWPAAMQVCPEGWHLPSADEWIHLAEYMSVHADYGDISEFIGSSLLGCVDGIFWNEWSSTKNDKDKVCVWKGDGFYGMDGYLSFSGMSFYTLTFGEISSNPMYSINSVRCVSDAGCKSVTGTTDDSDPCPMMQDYDGNLYSTVMIGKQCWTAENLRSEHDGKGNLIAVGETISPSLWINSTFNTAIPYRFYPNREPSNVLKYGFLYNNSAANNVCPSGWHLPSYDEWKQLINYLEEQNKVVTIEDFYFYGSSYYSPIAKVMASTKEWSPCREDEYDEGVGYNMKENNTCGFNALPAGIFINGMNISMGKFTAYWGQTPPSPLKDEEADTYRGNLHLNIFYNSSGVIDKYVTVGGIGASVRCVKDN